MNQMSGDISLLLKIGKEKNSTVISNKNEKSIITKKTTTCTHIDILQVQKVKYDAIPLPDDWWAQRPLDGTGKDSTEAHCYRGVADLLVLCQA